MFMIVDKAQFKQLKKDGGGIFKAIQSIGTIEFGYKEIKSGSALNFYVMNNGILVDVTFGKKIYINYDSIKDVEADGNRLLLKVYEQEETKDIVFTIQGNLSKIYNTIRQNANLGYKKAEIVDGGAVDAMIPQVSDASQKSSNSHKNTGGLTCPKCGSHCIQVISNEANTKSSTSLNLNPLKPFTVFNHKKKAKVSKGKIGLGILTGGASLLVTGVKNNKHLEVFCTECGHRWITK